MKSATIRLLVVLALFACAGIIITQIYWVRQAYTLQQRSFMLRANAALRSTAEDIWQQKELQKPAYSPVQQITSDYFIVQTNVAIEQSLLQHYLAAEFTKQNIITDFQYALSDCTRDTMLYGGYYHMPGTVEQPTAPIALAHLKRENYYFGVYFPHREEYLIAQLSLWMVTSLVLLCVICFLGYLLLIIFRQKRLSEIQKDFVNNMAHEFRTPLSTIQLSAEVLKNPGIMRQPQRLLNYATIIASESAQLTAHVDRILQMTRAEKSGLQLHKEVFAWQDIVSDQVAAFRESGAARDAQIRLHLPQAPVRFNGDVLHLKNALGNLLDNAVKYCEQCPQVDVTLQATEKSIIITVRDNGIGIDGQHQKMLFKKFYRVPTGNVHDVKGFGLGLDYVQLIAKAHTGSVQCSSELGKGSTFTLTFPQDKNLQKAPL